MFRDGTPHHNLGFGIPLWGNPDAEEGLPESGNSNAVQRALVGKPALQFFTTAAASLVAMHVAGKVAKGGGVRLAFKAQEMSTKGGYVGDLAASGIRTFRKVQEELDALQGLSRKLVDPGDPSIMVKRSADGKGWIKDDVTQVDGWAFRHNNPNVPGWKLRDEIQQRMVAQARRLPYELPAFYAADKMFIDPIMGNDRDRKVNWSNPFDVIGDFAYESLKNTAINVLPFEAGTAGAKHGYRKLMDHVATNPTNSPGLVTLKTTLEMVGADATDLVNRAFRFSNQSMGAFSQLVDDAAQSGKSFTQFIKEQNAAVVQSKPVGNSNSARRSWLRSLNITKNQDFGRSALDAMPGPFKGMGTALSMYKENFNNIGKTFDDWQDVISGRTSLAKLGLKDAERARKVQVFMSRGGGTYLEQFATSMDNLGRGGPTFPNGRVNPDWKRGEFYRLRSRDVYNGQLIDALSQNTGLTPEAASKFVRLSHKISPYPGGKAPFPEGENLMERIQFSSNKTHTNNQDVWWNSIVRGVQKHGIPFDPNKLTLDSFRSSVRQADSTFADDGFRRMMDSDIAAQWRHLHGQVLPQFAGRAIPSGKLPYDNFSNNALGQDTTRQFLIRRTAQRLGIETVDQTGNALPMDMLKNQIRGYGLNPNDPFKLRGYLVHQKDINVPWAGGTSNIFGIRSMTMQEALDNNYFAGNTDAVQKEISYLVNQKTFANAAGRGGNANAMPRGNNNLGRVYVNASGNVLDVGRLRRSFTAAMDTLSSDVQIPLLHFNPAQLMFSKKYQQMRNSPSINIVSANSLQPGAMFGKNDDFAAFIKTSAKSSRGKVVAVGGNNLGGVQSRVLGGTYRPSSTNAATLGGRYSRLFMGETGIPSSDTHSTATRSGRLKKRFAVSNDQRDSLFFGQNSVLQRALRARRAPRGWSLENPNRLAEAISKPGFSLGRVDANVSQGFDNLADSLRNRDFSVRTLRNLMDTNPEMRGVFDSALGKRALFDISDEELPGVIEGILARDMSVTFPVQGRAAVSQGRRAQNNLNALLTQGRQQNRFWDLPTSGSAKEAGLHRRIDQLRGELANYLVGTTDLRAGKRTFADVVRSVMGDVDTMYVKGNITAAERTEARAAILGMQVENARNMTYASFKPGTYNVLDHNRRTIERLLDTGVDTRQLMGEVGEFRPGSTGGRGFLRRKLQSATATDPYGVEDQVNPFGSSVLFEPTFGTAFANNPRKAMMGVAGLSWSEDAYSGAAIPATHLVMRLNKYFETFGVGLDATKFKSPVDMFARGMVGMRVAPAYAAGMTAYTLDSQLGGMFGPRDDEGNRVYSPLILGAGADVLAQGQIGLAGLIPGGQTASEKREELFTGQVPVRQGRWWMLGNTPFKGGRIQYFRPSWYQRFNAGAEYAPEMNQTPLEKLAFGYDFSPLRPLDPYRFERQNAQSRPYPVSGDYFTGPYGPITPALNATIGRVLKPRRQMVSDETLNQYLAQYQRVGQSGAYYPQGASAAMNQNLMNAEIGSGSANALYPAMGFSNPRGGASREVRGRAEQMALRYSNAARTPGSYVTVNENLVPYGVPQTPGLLSPRVVPASPMADYGRTGNQMRRLGYATQEMAGIYGFGLGSIRSNLGLGSQDLNNPAAMLQPASQGYSASRSFWGMNLGGLGDLPIPVEGQFANLEISEAIRRFVPREQAGDYINPLPNLLGQQYPWLPGSDYPLNPIATGDPYRQPDAAFRLPTTAYRRTNQVFGSRNNMSIANIHQILGNSAPWSQEYRSIDSMANGSTPMEQALIERTRRQVDAMRIENEFTPYEYKHQSAAEAGQHPISYGAGRFREWLMHRDTYVNRKFLPTRTAVEDWERDNVYGATFPEWSSPIDSFIKPMLHKSTQRDPVSSALSMGAIGSLFGVSAKAKLSGSVIGGALGLGAWGAGKGYEAVTGNRYLPGYRRQELALEEYTDILSYVRSTRNASTAVAQGDSQAASYFAQQAGQTMYGANLNSTPERLAMAVPSRKREHFRAMLYAPPEERGEVLSTAGRLERRMYQAAWGMPVEELPDLQEYFEDHELPPMDSSFWDPSVSMDNVKIKIGQSLGLDMAQMGYYPQQVKEANLINPLYPNMFGRTNRNTMAELQRLLYSNGGGRVQAIPTPFGGTKVQLNAGQY